MWRRRVRNQESGGIEPENIELINFEFLRKEKKEKGRTPERAQRTQGLWGLLAVNPPSCKSTAGQGGSKGISTMKKREGKRKTKKIYY